MAIDRSGIPRSAEGADAGTASAPQKARFAITVDVEHADMPGRDNQALSEVLDVLSGVPASFFLQGAWASAYPDIARRIAADPAHSVGCHSYYHAPYTILTRQGILTDLRKSRRIVTATSGSDPFPYVRLPFGRGVESRRVMSVLDEHGWQHVGWDLDTLDWDGALSRDGITKRVVRFIEVRSLTSTSSIMTFHSWPTHTPSAIAAALSEIHRHGSCELMTLSTMGPHPECLGWTPPDGLLS